MCFKLPPFGPSCTPICSYSLQVLRICSFSTKEYMSTLSWPLHPVSVLIQGQDYYFAIFGRILRFDSTDTVLGVQIALTGPIPMLYSSWKSAKGLGRCASNSGGRCQKSGILTHALARQVRAQLPLPHICNLWK